MLAPIFNYRDFHSMNTNHQFEIMQEIKANKIKLVIDKNVSHPVYMKTSDGKYIQHINEISFSSLGAISISNTPLTI